MEEKASAQAVVAERGSGESNAAKLLGPSCSCAHEGFAPHCHVTHVAHGSTGMLPSIEQSAKKTRRKSRDEDGHVSPADAAPPPGLTRAFAGRNVFYAHDGVSPGFNEGVMLATAGTPPQTRAALVFEQRHSAVELEVGEDVEKLRLLRVDLGHGVGVHGLGSEIVARWERKSSSKLSPFTRILHVFGAK